MVCFLFSKLNKDLHVLRLKPSDSMETMYDCWIQIRPLAYKTTGISEGTTILHVNMYRTSRSLQRPRQFTIYGHSYATSLTFDSDQIYRAIQWLTSAAFAICSIPSIDGHSKGSFNMPYFLSILASYNLIVLFLHPYSMESNISLRKWQNEWCIVILS